MSEETSSTDKPVVIFRHDLFLEHVAGPGHPENPGRLQAIYAHLDAHPLSGTATCTPREATVRELERVHGGRYVQTVAATAGQARVALDPDTSTSPKSYEAALAAAGAAIEATERVVQGDARGAFALVRPPGHHAEPSAAMGFCLFNNVAVAAAHAVSELGCRRVLVLDPDVHHGNGTQRAFYERNDVLYVSSHAYPFYPGSGWFDEVGIGVGAGHTVNLPMPPGMGDTDFLHVYERIVEPIVDEYRPDLILVSAGYDTWQYDPIGPMRMSTEGFRHLFGLFTRWSDRHCPGRIVLSLEGGYDPAGLIVGVRTSLEAMLGVSSTGPESDLGVLGLADSVSPYGSSETPAVSPSARAVAENARLALAPFWSGLRTATAEGTSA
ncbi:MAG: histone deacetylase [Candidatus Eisenbacteria bacterium]|uniref:Histone deacetylase n=1 Tax=Eiseniibacteriota bacterium TaxID=2212470 RepID=A0A956LYW8_UNCEI|nr:histone deacetylase [Candidatus Eisenbacteria bacterium]